MQGFLAALLATVVVANSTTAQTPAQRFDVGTHLGYTWFAGGTALEDAPFLGVDATYRIPIAPLRVGSSSANVGIGFTFAASRPITRGDQFPAVAFDFLDTTFLYAVAQQITLLHYGLQAALDFPLGRLRPYVFGGGGGYTIFLDSRQNQGNESFARGMLIGGGGIDYALRQTIGIRLEVRDFYMMRFNRDRLDPTVGYAQDRKIRDALPPPEPTSSKLHNLQASLVFSYVPNRGGQAGQQGETP